MKFRQISIAGPRGQNQDFILEPMRIEDATWCGIADGVGSAELGGLAARSSLEVVKQVAKPGRLMSEIFEQVALKLSELASEKDSTKSMSTTLSVLRIEGNQAHVGHVGDTRITHYREGGVMTRSKDQTEVQKLLDEGVISKNQARRYPRRNVLLSAMSAGREYELFEAIFILRSGDRILLTSDGLHNRLLRGQISGLSQENPEFEQFWKALEDAIAEEKFEDDASLLALEID